ncbi:hypothetical protein ACFWFF_19985 [Streptomyces sp. NPDC060223]|uniref:hypothetical protein n=1 Tax=unclassified Streptomyces TaxID=2593676 RepID=UPI00362D48C3
MAEYEGVDALLAAITDEPLPEGAENDAEFMAEHGQALADVALLREQLTLIGEALADGAKSAAVVGPVKPVRVRAPKKRRPLKIAFGALAVACAAGLMVGTGWLVVQAGQGVSDDSGASSTADKAAGPQDDAKGGSSFSASEYIACSRLIVEGTVAQVEPLPGTAQDRITLDVTRYYKPDKGKDEITFLMDEDAEPQLHKGDHVLVGIARGEASPDTWTTSEQEITQERTWILDALPDSRELGDLACE